ncbi:MAG: rubrerythrin [Deltaproteobacteria bacterium]|nr:MAG: rubrerythrin [Deltaproteobacteria bacterium]
MSFENLEEIFDFAIKLEQEAVKFYEDTAKEESMSGTKQMLNEMAEEERKHERLLKEMKSKGIVKGMDRYKFKWIPDIKRSNFLVDVEYEKGMAYNEILLVAMKKEEKALALYNDLLKRAEGEEAKKLFKIMCQEEARHKLKFETLYDDYMAEMGD